MVEIIYSVVIVVATFLGACAGLGGGVIIKPVLDAVQAHDVVTISFLSTAVVFTMSTYSIMKQLINKVKLDFCMILWVAFGSIIGGIIGEKIFSYFTSMFTETMVTAIQSLLLAMILVFVLIYVNSNFKSYCINSRVLYCNIGVFLGVLSSFLGIGGGPINVALFTLFFSIPLKIAVVYSLVTIFFSQAAKLMVIATTTGFASYDLTLLWFALPMAILGSSLGTRANRKFNAKKIKQIFNFAVSSTLLLTMYNFYCAFNIL